MAPRSPRQSPSTHEPERRCRGGILFGEVGRRASQAIDAGRVEVSTLFASLVVLDRVARGESQPRAAHLRCLSRRPSRESPRLALDALRDQPTDERGASAMRRRVTWTPLRNRLPRPGLRCSYQTKASPASASAAGLTMIEITAFACGYEPRLPAMASRSDRVLPRDRGVARALRAARRSARAARHRGYPTGRR